MFLVFNSKTRGLLKNWFSRVLVPKSRPVSQVFRRNLCSSRRGRPSPLLSVIQNKRAASAAPDIQICTVPDSKLNNDSFVGPCAYFLLSFTTCKYIFGQLRIQFRSGGAYVWLQYKPSIFSVYSRCTKKANRTQTQHKQSTKAPLWLHRNWISMSIIA